MNINNFIQELKRRNVIRVATAYAIAGWLIIQVVTSVSEPLGLPDWFDTAIIVLVLIGLPISLIIAWAFELTPEGLKKSEEVEITQSGTAATGKKINRIIISVLSLLVVFLLVERVFFAESTLMEKDTASITTTNDKSIAVLPFDDFNAGESQEYFADGLTEEILNSLAKTPDLLVASRTSSFQYKNKNVDVVKIADTLGVAHILEGSIRESTDKYRITAQLIRASDGFHLWSQTYDRDKKDIIDVQEDIAFQIATALETAMDPNALREMVNVGTTSVEAYKLYLEAISGFYKSDKESRLKSFASLEEATRIDPTFSSAWFLSASALLLDLGFTAMGTGGFEYSYDEKLRMVNERLSKAIQTADEISKLQYMATQAYINMELRKAADYQAQYLEKRPIDVESGSFVIDRYGNLGEFEIAKKYAEKIRKEALINKTNVGQIISFYFWNRNVGNAEPLMSQYLEAYPYAELLAYQAHRVMLWRGEYDRAREIKKRLRGLEIPEENFAISDIRQACADGEVELANQIYEERMKDGDLGALWIALKTLSRDDEADELLKDLHDRGQLISLASWLYYPYFDHTKYPKLNEILEREDHKRGPVEEIPFRCGR
mgnify:CR=1 FL=1